MPYAFPDQDASQLREWHQGSADLRQNWPAVIGDICWHHEWLVLRGQFWRLFDFGAFKWLIAITFFVTAAVAAMSGWIHQLM